MFPPPELAHFRAEFRWLQQATGVARDLDVHVLEFDAMRALVGGPGYESMQADLDPLLDVLRARRTQSAHEAGPGPALKARHEAAVGLAARSWTDSRRPNETERPDALRPIGEVAGERIRKVYRRMVRMGDAILASSPAEDYHELRKKGKELRYLLELLGASLYPGEVVKPMIKTLKGLQDVLGRHQDREVQVALLRCLAGRGGRCRATRAATLMAMGALSAGWPTTSVPHAASSRSASPSSRPSEQRRLVKDTFG